MYSSQLLSARRIITQQTLLFLESVNGVYNVCLYIYIYIPQNSFSYRGSCGVERAHGSFLIPFAAVVAQIVCKKHYSVTPTPPKLKRNGHFNGTFAFCSRGVAIFLSQRPLAPLAAPAPQRAPQIPLRCLPKCYFWVSRWGHIAGRWPTVFW